MNRELTTQERKRVREFAHRQCANYDRANRECPLLDGCCYMATIAFDDSDLCRYFRDAVLPLDTELERLLLKSCWNRALSQGKTRECPICGADFPAFGRRVYCSQRCSREADRKFARSRMRGKRKQG